jgi:hypothetical protein
MHSGKLRFAYIDLKLSCTFVQKEAETPISLNISTARTAPLNYLSKTPSAVVQILYDI